jgi:ADP-ribose pyrophosphatase
MCQSSDHLSWVELSRKKLLSSPIFDVYVSSSSAADGRKGEFYLLEAPHWVNIVPVVRAKDGTEIFLMVRQHRHGASMTTTEFPAGLCEPGEAPMAAAVRELEEETGRKAGKLTLLGRISPNPAFMGNWCYTYLAEDLSSEGEKSLDRLELLDSVEVPAESLMREIGTGEYVNSLTMNALFWYTLKKGADRNRTDA